ncbi:hypothetical protein [Ferruginibacter sp. HRS2-29]|uniref:hypothetical protein n=1 Tax=Ferruginibacter sp. HRS2-29 TaxID=2487334 RepID=UPI0020CE8903|nr:hypothetical protein [Ferruginibacter sp. HRS2-29]MCP9751853.1 hypothetical protein [Ferruginibacter sp. HRS2-29]
MKKSSTVKLILITAALASCNQKKKEPEWGEGSKTYVRGDSTAPYTRTHYGHGGNGLLTAALWYYAFRPYGNYSNGNYTRAGYYSSAISQRSNIGSNGFKGSVTRGGFGRSGYSVGG